MKSYALRRAGGGLLATQVALVHAGFVARPLLVIDTGSLYTIVEPSFVSALGLDSAKAIDQVKITGIGGRVRVPCFVVEQLHCFGRVLSGVRVLTLEFARILPSINGVLGLRELQICQATIDPMQRLVITL